LAVIGGDNSNRAAILAQALADTFADRASAPLFLITRATADKVREQDLMGIYPERCCRFCFTNRQMVRAMTEFLWTKSDLGLQPDPGPVYSLDWSDNLFSVDLVRRFRETLLRSEYLPMDDATANGEGFWQRRLPHSIGAFSRPNAAETAQAEALIDELHRHPTQRRALLVMPGNSWPARRFLRAVGRAAPTDAERLTVVNGDAIDFNTVYRDGNLTWSIQDLPFRLIFFCHRNPVDRKAGFRAAANASDSIDQDLSATTAADAGTYDLLVYADIVAAVTDAAFARPTPVSPLAQTAETGRGVGAAVTLLTDAGQFVANMRTARFDNRGNRVDGTGEHVVYLEPVRHDGRVLPQAHLRVYRRSDKGAWDLQPPDLHLQYGANTAETLPTPSAEQSRGKGADAPARKEPPP
jgi:hypothetical protein